MTELPRVPRLLPDSAECTVCLHEQSTDDMALAALPGGDTVWRCRNFARCAEVIHACAQDLHDHDAQHTHLMPRKQQARGLMASAEPARPAHEQAWELLRSRVREHRAELGIPEPEES